MPPGLRATAEVSGVYASPDLQAGRQDSRSAVLDVENVFAMFLCMVVS